jgi:hypothetical protein
MEEATEDPEEDLEGSEEEGDKCGEICRFPQYTPICVMPLSLPPQGGLHNQILNQGGAEGVGVQVSEGHIKQGRECMSGHVKRGGR